MKNHNAQNPVHRDVQLNGKTYRWVEDPQLTEGDRSDPNTIVLSMKEF